jgi:hypothetical protein
LYVGWGTPADLYEYQFLEFIYKYNISEKIIDMEDKDLFPLWKKYFDKLRG